MIKFNDNPLVPFPICWMMIIPPTVLSIGTDCTRRWLGGAEEAWRAARQSTPCAQLIGGWPFCTWAINQTRSWQPVSGMTAKAWNNKCNPDQKGKSDRNPWLESGGGAVGSPLAFLHRQGYQPVISPPLSEETIPLLQNLAVAWQLVGAKRTGRASKTGAPCRSNRKYTESCQLLNPWASNGRLSCSMRIPSICLILKKR